MIVETRCLQNDQIPDDMLRRIGDGDESALRELQLLTRKRVAGYVGRIVKDHQDAEEVIQDVYTYIWLHARNYRGERGTPWSWIYMLARSRALDRFRRLRRDNAETEFAEGVVSAVAGNPFPEPGVGKYAHLQACVLELPPGQRDLIRMAFFYGYRQHEISGRMGVPLGTIKSRVRAALSALRGKLLAQERPVRAA